MMHEDLLGYLLGALEPDEMRRVAQWLRDDPSARAELAKIERSLRPLQDQLESSRASKSDSPPPDLVERTLRSLPPLEPSTDDLNPFHDDPVTVHSPFDAALSPRDNFGRSVAFSDGGDGNFVAMNHGVEPPTGGRRSWFDWAGGAVSVAILLGLLLPMLANGRLEARKVACQDQFRQLGTALTNFVNRSQQNRLPDVAERGPEAFAGVYAVRLKQLGLLDDPSIRWCPSRDLPETTHFASTNLDEVVDAATLYRVSVEQLKRIQRYAGGHYAYSLGVIDTNGFTSPRFESRSTFAVMSDAPFKQPSGGSWEDSTVGHSGSGINVLYEDGRVQFVSLSSLDSMLDHPLRNHLGQGEAGINVDDASLAPSWRPPFVHVRQR